MLLAGTLREYPFSLLLEIFLHRRETGLLEISSSENFGYFYIKNGKVKDGQIGKSKGFAAVKVVREFKEGSFRFRPLEPAEYARVVWQRSFGPTAVAIGEAGRSAPVAENKPAQFRFVIVFFERARAVGRLLIQRTVAYATTASAFWKKAEIGTKALQVFNKTLAARPNTSRRSRQVTPSYSHVLRFYAPLPTFTTRAAIASALQQGVDHNVIFAVTATVLLGVSGLCVYQLTLGHQHSQDTGISIDQQVDTSANKAPTNKAKTKRSSSNRRSTSRLTEKSPSNKRRVRSTQAPDAAP